MSFGRATGAASAVATQGMNSNGIVAQSVGGGGGIEAFALTGAVTGGTVNGRLGATNGGRAL